MNLIIEPTTSTSYEFANGKYAQVSRTMFMVYGESNGQRELLIKDLYNTEAEARTVGEQMIQRRKKLTTTTPVASVRGSAPKSNYRVCPQCRRTSREANFSTCPPFCDDCA